MGYSAEFQDDTDPNPRYLERLGLGFSHKQNLGESYNGVTNNGFPMFDKFRWFSKDIMSCVQSVFQLVEMVSFTQRHSIIQILGMPSPAIDILQVDSSERPRTNILTIKNPIGSIGSKFTVRNHNIYIILLVHLPCYYLPTCYIITIFIY